MNSKVEDTVNSALVEGLKRIRGDRIRIQALNERDQELRRETHTEYIELETKLVSLGAIESLVMICADAGHGN